MRQMFCLLSAPALAAAFLAVRFLAAQEVPIADLTLIPPVVKTPPDQRYRDPEKRIYQTGPSITVSPSGRLWVSIMTGGNDECSDNYVDLITSGDSGETWSDPLFALDVDGPVRTFDPAIWTDPQGRLWWFFTQVYDFWDGRGGLWAMVCDDPDRADAAWHAPRRLCDGVMKNKPLVTSDGQWWMFVEQWYHGTCGPRYDWLQGGTVPRWYHMDTEHLGASIYCSADGGANWGYKASIPVPEKERTCFEVMAIEKLDHTFRALMRVKSGMAESQSTDGGATWSEAAAGPIKNPSARFFFARLRSGNILLIKNGPIDIQTSRRDITAYLSEDDGQTFPYKLELDMRELPSYPDACQGTDGMIYCVHDFDRRGVGEVILDRFTEDDIRAGKVVSPKSRLHTIVRQNRK